MNWGRDERDRICDLIKHEATILSQRVNSLVLFNGLSFLALVFAWTSAGDLVSVIALLGCAGTAVLMPPIIAADSAVGRLAGLWEKHRDPEDELPVVGLPASPVWRLVSFLIPVLFIVIWAKVLMMIADDSIFGATDSIKPVIKAFE